MTNYVLRLESVCLDGHIHAQETELRSSSCPHVGEGGAICDAAASWSMSVQRGDAILTDADITEMAVVAQMIMNVTGLTAQASLGEIQTALEHLQQRAATATLLEGGACNKPREEEGVIIPGGPCGMCIQCALAGTYAQVPGK